MKNEKISFSKLKLTNNKQLSLNNPQNQVRTFNVKFLTKLNFVVLDDSYT